MEPILLTDPATGSTARIAPHIGFNCYELQVLVSGTSINVIDADPQFPAGQARPSGHGIPLLFPFPNRIRKGQYTWQGRQYELAPSNVPFDPVGNAIHGFCLDRPWRVTVSGRQYAVGEFQLSVDARDRLPFWPADALIQVRYELRRSCLRADITIANPDDSPLPWGFGTHPYFRLPLGAKSEQKHCLIEASAAEAWELIDCLPTGIRRPIPADKDLREGAYFDQLHLDDVFTTQQPEHDAPASVQSIQHLIMDETAGLQVLQRCDPVFRELVVYTPPNRSAICLEPYTCVTDAINLQGRDINTGWRVLDPGDEFRTWIEIHAGPVIA